MISMYVIYIMVSPTDSGFLGPMVASAFFIYHVYHIYIISLYNISIFLYKPIMQIFCNGLSKAAIKHSMTKILM